MPVPETELPVTETELPVSETELPIVTSSSTGIPKYTSPVIVSSRGPVVPQGTTYPSYPSASPSESGKFEGAGNRNTVSHVGIAVICVMVVGLVI